MATVGKTMRTLASRPKRVLIAIIATGSLGLGWYTTATIQDYRFKDCVGKSVGQCSQDYGLTFRKPEKWVYVETKDGKEALDSTLPSLVAEKHLIIILDPKTQTISDFKVFHWFNVAP